MKNTTTRWQTLAAAAALTLSASPGHAAPPIEADLAEAMAAMTRVAKLEMQVAEDTRSFIGEEMSAERPVKGAPYCADAIHETVQWLPDPGGAAANRIVRRQTTRMCRDGEGRTRQEVERDGHKRIYLRDPVSRENWVLDPAQRTARKLGTAAGTGWPSSDIDQAAWREYGERMREWARNLAERMKAQARHGAAEPGLAAPPVPPTPPTPPVPPTPPTPVVVMSDDVAGGRDMHVRVLRSDGAGQAGSELALPPGLAFRAGTLAPRGPGVLTALGSKDIEGVRAGGERTTWTIEAGKMGNEKPIVITREIWRSPDLLLTVQSSDFDPRSGETRYRLSNLKRGEPDPLLMQVPADYNRRAPGGAPSAAPPATPAVPASRAKG